MLQQLLPKAHSVEKMATTTKQWALSHIVYVQQTEESSNAE